MQTIGERLEDARKRKGISIREAAEATKIRGEVLQKFEGNQFDLDLASIYLRGFLRNYATFLKLPADRIINDYEALGHAEARPRQPSREVYGRMDVSIASAEDRDERPAPPPAAAEPAPRPGPQLRGHSTLPKTPAIDPALVFKAGVVLVVLVLVLLVVWLVKSLMPASGAAARSAAVPVAVSAAASEPSLTLVALDAVRVRVLLVLPDGKNQQLVDTAMERGQTMDVPRSGPVLIYADVRSNLQFEINGKSYAMPAGSNWVRLP